MNTIRKVEKTFQGRSTLEGAGVRLKRVFGFPQVPLFDPFLLLDDFHSGNPEDYRAGFPMHPHRGIETITYLVQGAVAHRDSLGHHGVIRAGDVQWMTAGSGIIHEEMPQAPGMLWGFQLWANLPASHKMTDPKYRDVRGDEVPEVSPSPKVRIKVICGEVEGVRGPVGDIVTDPEYLDLAIGPDEYYEHPIREGYTCFAYVLEGEASFGPGEGQPVSVETAVLFGEGERVGVRTAHEAVRFLLVSGRPIGEPVAWYGPIVMNTREELETAFREYQEGTFIKLRPKGAGAKG